MSAPPGWAHSPEPTLEQIEREKETDFSTRRAQLRYLVSELGVTRPQAKALVAAYEADRSDAQRIGNDTCRSDVEFLDWLLRQAPGGKKPSVRQWRVGEGGGWRVRS